LANTYTVIEQIARGGFGRVERIKAADGRTLARKVFDPSPELGVSSAADLEKLRRRFEREVRVQSYCAKHGAIPILDSDLKADPPWFVMPLADKNYAEQIKEDRTSDRPTRRISLAWEIEGSPSGRSTDSLVIVPSTSI
jgi:eukaryotic-like serine/threonine-protein kinase